MTEKGPGLSEFTSAFLSEAEELLAIANRELLAADEAVQRGARNGKAIREAFRAVHTIKGLAAMVGVDPIVTLSHRMESILRRSDRAGSVLPSAAIDLVIAGLGAIQQALQAVARGAPVPEPSSAFLDSLEALDAAPAPETGLPRGEAPRPETSLLSRLGQADREQLEQGLAAGKKAWVVEFIPSPELTQRGINITSVRRGLATVGEIVKAVPVSRPGVAPGGVSFAVVILTARPPAEVSAASQVPVAAITGLEALAPLAGPAPGALDSMEDEAVGPAARNVVRVEISRLDEAMDGLSALIVSRFRMARAVAALSASGVNTRELDAILRDTGRELRELRAAILRVRLIPAAEVLERIPLLVRGLCRTTGKKVHLDLDPGSAELDKKVAERIFPALVHLIRNAIDHAIEAPAERRRAGKAEEGSLRVRCRDTSTNELEISVEDDGRGIDREQVAARAGRAPPADDAGLLDLICLPGLSTRESATTTSGRGMGMDIVKRVVTDQLGGELRMTTGVGRGTRFTLRIPLTLTILDAFSLECADQQFLVPVAAVEEILALEDQVVVRGPSARSGDLGMVERRGEAIPVVRLDRLFRISRPGRTGADEALPPGAGKALPPGAGKALVVRRGSTPIAFAVDRMLGQQEVVVRPLDDALVRVPGVGGSTDLGDGRPTLVLDLPALVSRILDQSAELEAGA